MGIGAIVFVAQAMESKRTSNPSALAAKSLSVSELRHEASQVLRMCNQLNGRVNAEAEYPDPVGYLKISYLTIDYILIIKKTVLRRCITIDCMDFLLFDNVGNG